MHIKAIGANMALKDVFYETGEKVRTHLFKIDGCGFTTVEGGHSIRLDFSPFSFYHLNGQPAKSLIDLHLEEVNSRSALLAAEHSCFSQGQLLDLFTQFRIRAFSDGEPLLLRKGALVRVKVPKEFDGDIFSFKGGKDDVQMLWAKEAFDWERNTSGKGTLSKTDHAQHFEFRIKNLGWWSVGTLPFEKSKKIMISARHQPLAKPLKEKAAYLILEGYNTVVKLFEGNKYFSTFNIPENIGATILMIGTDGELLYFGQKKISSVCKSIYYVPLEVMSTVALKHHLKRLDRW